MDFCARCGQQAQPGQPFCPRCGLALRAQPPGFPPLQSLTGAWQASVAADQDYAAWARDESTHGCRAHDTANAHYQATSEANREATTGRTTFTGLWNPIAVRYNLPSYRQDEL